MKRMVCHLADLGADVRLRIYSGRPHIVSEAELVAARAFLTTMVEEARA